MKSALPIYTFIENLLKMLVVIIVVFSVGQAIAMYLREYHTGILANIRASIYLLEGLSMAFSFLIAANVVSLIYLRRPKDIYLIVLLTLVKKLNTVFLNQDIEDTRQKKIELLDFSK